MTSQIVKTTLINQIMSFGSVRATITVSGLQPKQPLSVGDATTSSTITTTTMTEIGTEIVTMIEIEIATASAIIELESVALNQLEATKQMCTNTTITMAEVVDVAAEAVEAAGAGKSE